MTVLPLYNVILVPETNLYIQTDSYKKMTGKDPQVQERVILVAEKEKKTREELTESDLYPIGLAGIITEVNANGYIVIRTKKRADITEITVFADHTLAVTANKREDLVEEEVDKEAQRKRLDKLNQSIVEYTSRFQWASIFHNGLLQFIQPLSLNILPVFSGQV